MRFIGTRAHGYIDYIVGVLLIAAPWIFQFYRGEAESWVPIILGASIILYSLLTDYELGVSRTISMRTHLALDVLGGIFLAVSPWLFDFADYIWEPHVIVGVLETAIALMTKRTPVTERGDLHRRSATT